MIQLGTKVKDKITGFIGIAIARCVYLNGCVQYSIKPPIDPMTKEMRNGKWIDEGQLIIVKAVNIPDKPTKIKIPGGGIRSHPF